MKHDLKYSEDNLAELSLNPEAHFENCEFSAINFSDYSLKSIFFTDCKFINCNLANQDLTNTTMRDTSFESCNLIGINWCNLKRFEGPKFKNCKLNFSSFQAIKLKKSVFENCLSIDVDFSDCDLTDSNFTKSNLAGANFNRATLINCNFRYAKDYLFDLRTTKVKGLRLTMPEALNLITVLGAEVEF